MTTLDDEAKIDSVRAKRKRKKYVKPVYWRPYFWEGMSWKFSLANSLKMCIRERHHDLNSQRSMHVYEEYNVINHIILDLKGKSELKWHKTCKEEEPEAHGSGITHCRTSGSSIIRVKTTHSELKSPCLSIKSITIIWFI